MKQSPMPETSRSVFPVPPLTNDQPDIDTGFRALDRMAVARRAQLTSGLSPAALNLAFTDWSSHLALAPGKRLELMRDASRDIGKFAAQMLRGALDADAPPSIAPAPDDNRFDAEEWQQQPYALWVQSFLLGQKWWQEATTGVPGVNPHHQDMVSFAARQILDIFSPSNNPLTNPEVIKRTLQTGGMNFVQGFQNWLEDASRLASGQMPVGTEDFVVGRDVAITPGKVIWRNELIELIQYEPTTKTVMAEPVLIVPAWIMKYYILDLSPHNSLIRYLVDRGHTVFCISWRNPTEKDRNLGMADYRRLGVMAALDAVTTIIPDRKVHGVGYCIGGTLLSIAAASMGCQGDDRLASLTLLAAQTDFTEPGELALFIDHSQMHYLESMMWDRGYLSADQMAGAFQLLRANDLIWSQRIREYMLGERSSMFDLMAWNADSTRLPWRMHSEYLQRLYLDNELAAGRYMVEGRPAALQNLRIPLFVVGTERDHVAPWKSVYKIHYLSNAEVTFVLASGGHNAGIISEPGRPRRHYRVGCKGLGSPCRTPEQWAEKARVKQGSWWEEWADWLAERSATKKVSPPGFVDSDTADEAMRRFVPIMDAPGEYVMQR